MSVLSRTSYHTLRLIMGDQLNYQHSWYRHTDVGVLYLIMEMRQETDYVRHHIQKIIGFFAAMYNFAKYLCKHGHEVKQMLINDPDNRQSLNANLHFIIETYGIKHFEYQLPDEYRLDEQLRLFCQDLPISHRVYDTEHFYTEREELAQFFKSKRPLLMENFYRHMRLKHHILMAGDLPEGGIWNYDKDNRKALGAKAQLPRPWHVHHNYSDILLQIQKAEVQSWGEPHATHFHLPTSRKQGLAVLDHFLQELLPYFGTYQDAMHTQSWHLYHSRLSFAMNLKMISPKEVVHKALQYWQQHAAHISLSQIEGFVRQILGWREYMRGVYWMQMPEFKNQNYLQHTRPLPTWYWTANTRMNCLHHAIKQIMEYSYGHHIQRLMITGNFALLAGIAPLEVDSWYLGVYHDAVEWVQLPNTHGMSQYADGGLVGSKPYVSSANYIDKMSNYCKTCHYDKNTKVGPKACPFNSLYWHFYERHRALLSKNQRIGMMYQIWDKMPPEQQLAILSQAEHYLDQWNEL